jgi:DNA modification methylase
MLHIGDTREGLRQFAAQGIRAQTCVTSPPYWGLRDYGHAGQIGLEPTPDAYVATMVDVFRLVRDVLADDGTLWLNLGDSYSGAGPSGASYPSKSTLEREGKARDGSFAISKTLGARGMTYADKKPIPAAGLKAKDLCGIPWRVAFALQADGWYLRSDIIWHKPNPMPESVTDRPTKAHEYLFLLAKSERYYYDAAAIYEAATSSLPVVNKETRSRNRMEATAAGREGKDDYGSIGYSGDGSSRNRRSVWSITTEPYADAHFAVMPTALVEPCIAAGSRVGDVVLDPFMGSGTVAAVAQNLGRRWIGCELNQEYAAMIRRRSAQQGLEFIA